MPRINRPAGTVGEAYAIEELRVEDREQARDLAREEAIERAIEGNVATNRSALTVHNIRPDADLNFGAVAYEQWLTGALVAAAINTPVNDVLLDVKKTLVIYGGFINEPNPSAGEILFRQNAGGSLPLLFVNVQHIRSNLVNKWIMSEMVAYDPQDIMNIQFMPTITDAAGQVMGFLGWVAEPKGRPFLGPSL